MVDIEESALDTAGDGLYRVCRDGHPVEETHEAIFVATTGEWEFNQRVYLVARVRDPKPDESYPDMTVRADGKALFRQFYPVDKT
jgi:hypothetical protein